MQPPSRRARTSPREPVSAASGAFADQATALTWLDSERANLIASVAAAAAAGDQDIATRLPVILYDYLIWRGYVDDLIAVTTIACTVAHQAGALAAEAGAWNNLGIALTEASRYDDAVTAHGRAVDLFTSLENQHERGKALNGLGSVLRDSGRPAAALPIHQAALAAQKDAGDLWEQAAVLNNLSLDHQELGNVAEACAAAEQAASLFQQLGDTTCEAKALCTAAFALQAAGRSQEAHGVCERAVEAASRSAGSPRDAAAILMTCAELLTDLTPQQWIAYLLRAQAACGAPTPTIYTRTPCPPSAWSISPQVTQIRPPPISRAQQACSMTSISSPRQPKFAHCFRCSAPDSARAPRRPDAVQPESATEPQALAAALRRRSRATGVKSRCPTAGWRAAPRGPCAGGVGVRRAVRMGHVSVCRAASRGQTAPRAITKNPGGRAPPWYL